MDKHPLKADSGDRNSDRRHREDRRKTYTDPKDLPFPDRRKGDRRQMDRRVVSDEEKSEILSRVVPSSGPSSKKPSENTV